MQRQRDVQKVNPDRILSNKPVSVHAYITANEREPLWKLASSVKIQTGHHKEAGRPRTHQMLHNRMTAKP